MNTQHLIGKLANESAVDHLIKIPSGFVDLAILDPPYFGTQQFYKCCTPLPVLSDWIDWTREYMGQVKRVMKVNSTAYLFGYARNLVHLHPMLLDLDLHLWQVITLVRKEKQARARHTKYYRVFPAETESIFMLRKGAMVPKVRYNFKIPQEKGKKLTDVWVVKYPQNTKRANVLGTKPQIVMRRLIVSSSKVGDVVLDPFMGAGTTAIVAHKLKRRWIGCEIDPDTHAYAQDRILHHCFAESHRTGEPVCRSTEPEMRV